MDMIKFGEFLKALRKEKELTQEQLGEKLGVTGKTVSRWETGTYMPPVQCLKLLSEFYGLTINELLAGERLDEASFKKAAEKNIEVVFELSEKSSKRIDKFFTAGLVLSFVLCSLIIFYLPDLSKLEGGDKMREIIVIICVVILGFLANTQNLIGQVLNNLISGKGDKDK